MNYYSEFVVWNDGTEEEYEVLHRNDYEAEQYAKKEFEEYPQIMYYRVFRERITVALFERKEG